MVVWPLPENKAAEDTDIRAIPTQKAVETALWEIVKGIAPFKFRPKEIQVRDDQAATMFFDTEKAAVSMRATWAETVTQGQVREIFGQKVNVRKSRSGGEQAMTKLSQFMMKAAEQSYGKGVARRWMLARESCRLR